MIYAGIGSRSTPDDILLNMQWSAQVLGNDGWLLRSGGADGADKAFEKGCDLAGGSKEIWLPWKGFNGSKSSLYLDILDANAKAKAYHVAMDTHPAWDRCNRAAQSLHARNVLIILGADFNTPVDEVICWTPEAAITGGTGLALRLAKQYNIPITNLADAQT